MLICHTKKELSNAPSSVHKKKLEFECFVKIFQVLCSLCLRIHNLHLYISVKPLFIYHQWFDKKLTSSYSCVLRLKLKKIKFSLTYFTSITGISFINTEIPVFTKAGNTVHPSRESSPLRIRFSWLPFLPTCVTAVIRAMNAVGVLMFALDEISIFINLLMNNLLNELAFFPSAVPRSAAAVWVLYYYFPPSLCRPLSRVTSLGEDFPTRKV